jgi:acetolactate synthase-1/2/3 large subunit
MLGTRFSEIPSQGYELFPIPKLGQKLVHIHPGAEELGRVYAPDLSINATPEAFLQLALTLTPQPGWSGPREARAAFEDWTATPPDGVGKVTMSHVVSVLRDSVPSNTMITNGAGNYGIWVQRFWRYGRHAQLGPTSGSMGYGLPAAIAYAMRRPDNEVICFAGDGCFQMTCQEFGLAAERSLPIRVIVCDNASYGTIRMHQERDYPGRQSGTKLLNPDFKTWAVSYGAKAFSVNDNERFADVLAEARMAQGPSLIHLHLDPRDISPGKTVPS